MRAGQALEIDSGLAMARVNLAWALANQGRVSEALAEFERAGRLEPDLPGLELKWGLTLGLHGRAVEALPHLLRAIELRPDDPAVPYACGSTLVELGRNREAVREFESVLRLDPTAEGARRILDRLRRGGVPP